jgi:hypothetical protein
MIVSGQTNALHTGELLGNQDSLTAPCHVLSDCTSNQSGVYFAVATGSEQTYNIYKVSTQSAQLEWLPHLQLSLTASQQLSSIAISPAEDVLYSRTSQPAECYQIKLMAPVDRLQ